MFSVTDADAISRQTAEAEARYLIRAHDQLELEVYTNKGERILDPDFAKVEGTGSVGSGPQPARVYTVNPNGQVRFPLVGDVKLEGITLDQAEQVLQQEYTHYYKEPFVALKFANKRVVVLGAPGGRVVPLPYENVRLTEVLALAEGLDDNARADNIRVLRGKDVFVANLSTVDGYRNGDMIIQPGDIIYVEPVRRPFSEGLRDYGPILSLITSIGTLIIVILQTNP